MPAPRIPTARARLSSGLISDASLPPRADFRRLTVPPPCATLAKHLLCKGSRLPDRYQSVFRPGLFAGQVALVTGGGSGLGRCTAHELASLGAKVALIGRKIEKLSTGEDESARAGGEARRYAYDLPAGVT